ncbi:DUF3696 domain-containing protein [Delftia acidovorans]|uniref:DUF3696 domain-containing protein n=1 Tax=Delftia acidovorans TaxID=80866 RepID=A0AAJ2R779_DELAC|nr:DUF3696 domain-containing protein [Delftia acidovorans]MDX4956422.1 DUF3696 domain-containing protein [Delftia acidovorans]
MHLISLRLVNFKKFENIEIDLTKRLILLVGPNSVGKTSIIKAILALKQTFSNENDHDVFNARGSLVDLGTYKDYIYDHEIKKDFMFSGVIDNPGGNLNSIDIDVEKISFDINYGFNGESDQAYLIGIEFNFYKGNDKFTLNVSSKKNYKNGKNELDYVIEVKNIERFAKNSMFVDFFLKTQRESLSKNKILYKLTAKFNLETSRLSHSELFYSKLNQSLVDECIKSLKLCFDDGFSYIGPIRQRPERFSVRNSYSKYVGASGENTASVLTNLYNHQGQRQKFNKINEDFSFLLNKKVDAKSAGELTKIRILNIDGDSSESISDVGFGISQILPIVTQLNICEKDQRLILEQPELHLHPESQTKLAKLFSTGVQSKKFLIETHSEHLIRGVQLAIHDSYKKQDGVISSADVSIIYISENDGALRTKNMKIDASGKMEENWPKGFFDQAYKFTMIMLGA